MTREELIEELTRIATAEMVRRMIETGLRLMREAGE